MVLFLIVIVLFLAGLALSRWGDMSSETQAIASTAMIVIGGLALIIITISAVTSKAGVPGQIASYEALREAASQVNLQSSEDVYGKVVDFNTDLAQTKWLNGQWWGDPFVPDEWMSIQPIPVKK